MLTTFFHDKRGFSSLALVAIMLLIPSMILLGLKVAQTIKNANAQEKTNTTVKYLAIDRNWLIGQSKDSDSDSYYEPPKENGTALPVSAPHLQDSYGSALLYCTWDLGTANSNTTYSQNNIAPPKSGMAARIVSAGKDKIFQTTCSDVTIKGDDIAVEILSTDIAAGLPGAGSGWQINGNDMVQVATGYVIFGNGQVTRQPTLPNDIVNKKYVVDQAGSFVPSSSSVTSVSDVFSSFTYIGNGASQVITNGIDLSTPIPDQKEAVFTTPGTYQWTAPAGVTSVSVVCVGGGGASTYSSGGWGGGYGGGSGGYGAGGGGGLAYKNNITVVPGNNYTVVIGAGGTPSSPSGTASAFNGLIAGGGNGGGNGGGGSGGNISGADGGGAGGNGGSSGGSLSGGGGAGGYTGNGGAGGNAYFGGGYAGSSGTGGGGGGGGGTDWGYNGGGGGTGLYGEGTSGAGGTADAAAGSPNSAGKGGSSGADGISVTGSKGGSGACRIIWGEGRSFPNAAGPIYDNTRGGLVWAKCRSTAYAGVLFDTIRGPGANVLRTSTTDGIRTDAGSISFNSNGYTMDSNGGHNASSQTYVSWTFKKAPKFFNIVTYTGDGAGDRQIPHSLGITPGMVIVKATSTTGDWWVGYKGQLTAGALKLNTTDAHINTGAPSPINLASDSFWVHQLGGNWVTNTAGVTYVAYLFANDTSTTGIIRCGELFTTDASGNATVDLGWEPQWVLFKGIDYNGPGWEMVDTQRGISSITSDARLNANSSSSETSGNLINTFSTGFYVQNGTTQANGKYVYCAIRKP